MTEETRNRIARFFSEERSRMVNYVRRLISDTAERDSEDIVQDVMCRIFDAPDIAAPIENLSAYIFMSLRNRAIDILRKRKPELSLDTPVYSASGGTLADVLHDSRYDTAADYEKEEMRQALFSILDGLGENERDIIVMNDLEGRSFREISEELDIPVGTLLSRKSRAINKIRKKMEQIFTE